jgi:hypothetical protein
MDPLVAFFAIPIIESFLQSIKDHAIGALILAVGPQVSHRDILDLDGAALAKFPYSCEWKLDPRFVMMVLVKPNRCKMSQMKLTTRSAKSFIIGLY